MDYSVHMLARSEHQLQAKSIRPVPEFGSFVKVRPAGWLSRQTGHLRYALGRRIISLGERMPQGYIPPIMEPNVKMR